MGMKTTREEEKQNHAAERGPRGSAPAADKTTDVQAGNVAEGAHFGKARRQSQKDTEYK